MVGETELLPCPFCDGEARSFKTDIHPGYQTSSVKCRTCGAATARSDLGAIANWNTRANSRDKLQSENENLREAVIGSTQTITDLTNERVKLRAHVVSLKEALRFYTGGNTDRGTKARVALRAALSEGRE